MTASANPPHIKPYTLIKAYSDHLVARTNQENRLLYSRGPDDKSRSAVRNRNVHGENQCVYEVRISSEGQC